MSWDSYIDNLLAQCGEQADQACIVGLDGSRWTTDSHPNSLKMSQDEITKISSAFKTCDMSALQASGIVVNGVKYQYLRGDDRVILGKRKDCGSITLQKSKKAAVIAHTKEGGQQGNTNKGVGVIAEYLETLDM